MIELFVHFKRIRKKKRGSIVLLRGLFFVDCHMSVVSIFLVFFFFGIGKDCVVFNIYVLLSSKYCCLLALHTQ